jgi:wyosine [tRNA(Phe)-imidazoG37] synthetase (radical SAM superfamily)
MFASRYSRMGTFLFDKIIFGPVKSRRLGVSLGINLLPADSKWCSFNCIYCECGWTSSGPYDAKRFPEREMIREQLEKKLLLMREQRKLPDTITFAGNGEPTLHPEFAGIISDTLLSRDTLAPEAAIAVLSNGTKLGDPDVFNALEKVDQNILKIDSARDETFRLLNQPPEDLTLDELVENIKLFKGRFILQTLFVKGTYNGITVDNSSEGEIGDWLELAVLLRPRMIMVYTIARDTPVGGLMKVSSGRLQEIAGKVKELGIPVQVSG